MIQLRGMMCGNPSKNIIKISSICPRRTHAVMTWTQFLGMLEIWFDSTIRIHLKHQFIRLGLVYHFNHTKEARSCLSSSLFALRRCMHSTAPAINDQCYMELKSKLVSKESSMSPIPTLEK